MLRRVTWRFWAGAAAAVAVYMVVGLVWLDDNSHALTDLFDYGWLAMIAAPLLWVTVSTATTPWWKTDVGVNFFLVQAAMLPMSVIFSVVFTFHQGRLGPGVVGWVVVGTPWWSALVLLWRTLIYLRLSREQRQQDKAERDRK